MVVDYDILKLNNDKFIAIVNALGEKIANNTLTFFDTQTFYRKIAQYSAHQFSQEKNFLDNSQICDEFKDEFKKAQDGFLNELSRLCQESSEELFNSVELLNFLIYWLDTHIIKRTALLFEQVKLIKNEQLSPKDAYIKAKDNFKELSLVRVINSMIDVVFDKNRELRSKNDYLESLLIKRDEELNYLKDKYRDSFSIDPITGLKNRGEALKYAKTMLEKTKKEMLYAVMIKFDEYKELLSSHGISTAKDSLAKIADIFQLNLRSDDRIFALNAGEFLLICVSPSQAGVINAINRLIAKVEENSELNLLTSKDKNTINTIVVNCANITEPREIMIALDERAKAMEVDKNSSNIYI